jgi:hypothetical protein
MNALGGAGERLAVLAGRTALRRRQLALLISGWSAAPASGFCCLYSRPWSSQDRANAEPAANAGISAARRMRFIIFLPSFGDAELADWGVNLATNFCPGATNRQSTPPRAFVHSESAAKPNFWRNH